MDIICMSELKGLMEKFEGPHVSIFMPTHRGGGSSPEDLIRFKNLIRRAEDTMVADGLRSPDAKHILRPAQRLLQDSLFWRKQGDGLAIYANSKLFIYYRIPAVLEEMIAVAPKFHIKPLISLLSGCGIFYVLGLSQHGIRFLQCTEFSAVPIEVNFPRDIEDALAYDVPDNQVSYHVTGTSGNVGGRGMEGSTRFQGAPVSANYNKENIKHYFDLVDKSLHTVLQNEKSPLVVKGVEYILPIYREANTYPHLFIDGIRGSPKLLTDSELRQQAWATVQPYFKKLEHDSLAQYAQDVGTGSTSTDLKEVLQQSAYGKVRFLFVAEKMHQWGIFKKDTNETVLHEKEEAGDEDLLDLAAYNTMMTSGSVFVLPQERVPGGGPIAAIFRF